MTIYDVIERQRTRLNSRDEAFLSLLSGQWRQVEREIAARAELLAEEVARRQAQGEEVSAGKLFQLERYRLLAQQTRDAVARYADDAAPRIAGQQERFAGYGADDARAQLGEMGVSSSFTRLPVGATNVVIGTTADGSPLRDLLAATWPDAMPAMAQRLISNTARGVNPRVTAREMASASGASLARVLTISRTECMRAYREASRSTYLSSGVTKYRRIAAKNRRTCVACLALDGRIYDTSQPMPIHPNDRCTSIPIVDGYSFPARESGADWFSSQPASVQKEMLGPSRYELYKQGMPIIEFVRTVVHPTWGATIQIKPLG